MKGEMINFIDLIESFCSNFMVKRLEIRLYWRFSNLVLFFLMHGLIGYIKFGNPLEIAFLLFFFF